ncbi:MAG: hypothetical protein ABGW87_09790 [Sphingomonadaceae bacterium]
MLAALVAVCAVLTLFPQKYRAAVSLTPTDPSSLGLSGTLGQLGAGASVFGSQAAVEISLKVARSPYVEEKVVNALKLDKILDKSPQGATRWLERKVDVRTLRGGILQIEMEDRDAQFAKKVVSNYATAMRAQLAQIARGQTAYKRQILEELLSESSQRYLAAQAAYNNFRLTTGQGNPKQAILQGAARIPGLQEQILNKQFEIGALEKFATPQNLQVQKARAELDALKQQLTSAQSQASANSDSVKQIIRQSTELVKLQQELEVSQKLYENYKRFMEGTSVEDLAATANVRILEPPYIDPDRQYNWLFASIGLVILLGGLAIEFYRLRPPLEGREDDLGGPVDVEPVRS